MRKIAAILAVVIGMVHVSAQEVEVKTAGTQTQVSASGTLPVVYVSTGGKAIVDKETYLPMQVWIDPLSTGYQALGSQNAPISGEIKGRGNWTWRGFDKKPYKIKLEQKTEVLGMPKQKHWCLMAGADDNLGFLRNTVGYMLSEAVGMKWTPSQVPVELMLNGEYMGLYFLTEHIRIDQNRVNISSQEDGQTDDISGGWLVEIDNYDEEGNVKLTEGNGELIMVTPKQPEVLSNQQRDYLTQQMNAINEALYGQTSDRWQQLIDLDEAAKFYLIQEILYDCESYHGSCYLYKDKDGASPKKWFFGPVWDFGNAYRNRGERFIYDRPEFSQIWIGQLAQWPEFQQKVMEKWWLYVHEQHDQVVKQIDDFCSQISAAAKKDGQRWENSGNVQNNSDMSKRKRQWMEMMTWRINWLKSRWHNGVEPDRNQTEETTIRSRYEKRIENGQIVIEVDGQKFNIEGQRIPTNL